MKGQVVRMPTERILVTVKTYPTLSSKYVETVCTAGLRENGSWVRLYPVPFRALEKDEQYSKFDVIECETHDPDLKSDPRPESRRVNVSAGIRKIEHIDTKNNWKKRWGWIGRSQVQTSMNFLVERAHKNEMSLATFKPGRVLEFIIEEEEEREWPPEKIQQVEQELKQPGLFGDDGWKQQFRMVQKVPYSFSYRFQDESGKESTMKILDWEAGALYWNCLRNNRNNESAACADVRRKYEGFLSEKVDIHFFLGTTREWHLRKAPNPWTILGVAPLPRQRQMVLPGF